jgi:hypothetical protein
MNINDRFATRAQTINATPEPFRREMIRAASEEPLRLLIFGPAVTNMGVRSPATLLGLTARRWILVSDNSEGGIDAIECDFADTLLVEITALLLYGRLKIDYATAEELHTCAVEFNTVDEELYCEATELLLAGIEETVRSTTESEKEWSATAESLKGWPLKFYNAMIDYLPIGHRLLGAVHWPAVVGGFHKELSPAAAIGVTERELLLISEERSAPWDRARKHHAKLGCIVTYFPRIRLAKFHLDYHAHFTILELEMHASHGSEGLKILMPPYHAHSIAELLGKAAASHQLMFGD